MHRKVPPESGKPALACKFQKYWPQDWHHQIIMVWNFVLSPNGSHDIFNLSSCPVMVNNNKDLLRKRNAPKGANQSLVSSFGMFTSRIWVIQPGMKIFVWKPIFCFIFGVFLFSWLGSIPPWSSCLAWFGLVGLAGLVWLGLAGFGWVWLGWLGWLVLGWLVFFGDLFWLGWLGWLSLAWLAWFGLVGLVWLGWLGLVWLACFDWAGLIWLGLVWFGLVWLGLAWLGLVGLVWLGWLGWLVLAWLAWFGLVGLVRLCWLLGFDKQELEELKHQHRNQLRNKSKAKGTSRSFQRLGGEALQPPPQRPSHFLFFKSHHYAAGSRKPMNVMNNWATDEKEEGLMEEQGKQWKAWGTCSNTDGKTRKTNGTIRKTNGQTRKTIVKIRNANGKTRKTDGKARKTNG